MSHPLLITTALLCPLLAAPRGSPPPLVPPPQAPPLSPSLLPLPPTFHPPLPPGVQFDQNDLSVQLGEIKLMEAGQPLAFDNAVGGRTAWGLGR